jgi:hypothetical protein
MFVVFCRATDCKKTINNRIREVAEPGFRDRGGLDRIPVHDPTPKDHTFPFFFSGLSSSHRSIHVLDQTPPSWGSEMNR